MKKPMSKSSAICYSRGKDKIDNNPAQEIASDFDEFERAIISDKSPCKGTTFFCGPLSVGPHDRPHDYPEEGHYRLATHAMPRRFLATDQDGYRDVETHKELFRDFSTFRGFGYTTWSHTDEKPRSRAVFELNREVSRAEGIALGKAFDRMIQNVYGLDAVASDKSVYQNEQPVYSPGPNASIFYFQGEPLDVDEILKKYPEVITVVKPEQAGIMTTGNSSKYSKLTITALEKVLGFIDCTNEPVWFDVSNALARAYGEGGREIFHKFSKGLYWGTPYEKFNSTKVDEKFNRSLKELESRPNGFGVRHLVDLAGLTTNDVEFEVDIDLQIAFGINTSEDEGANSIVFPVLNKQKKPLQVTDNLAAVLNAYGITARYNQVAKQAEFIVPGLNCVLDESDNTALTTVTDYAIKAGLTAVRVPELLDCLASQNPYCPVRTYIESKAWDGVGRLTEFINQIKCGNQVLATIFLRKWLIQAVAAVYESNGIANAGVLVLTGEQGVGKTRLFKDLTNGIPKAFLEGQTLNPADKDSVMSVASHWIVELGELDSTFRKADIAQLKAFITKTTDTLRRPYARKDSRMPRRTVFAGTVNDFHCLHDTTGNRRFWPIDVEGINRDTTIDYQQLWAQAKFWYDSGESWHLNNQERLLLDQYSETFMVTDPDVEALLDYYPFIGCTCWTPKKMKDIFLDLEIEKPNKSQQMRLAEAIRKYNGKQKPRETNGVKYHFVPDRVAMKALTNMSALNAPSQAVAPAAPS